MALSEKIQQITQKYLAELYEAMREATIDEIRQSLFTPKITEEGGKFILTLPDGQQFFRTRRRDLVLKARQMGYSIA